jgi:hypothetical protein
MIRPADRSASVLWVLIFLAVTVPAVSVAQVPGVKTPSLGLTLGLKVSTLGFGPEIGYSFGPRLGVRGGFQLATINSFNLTSNNIQYGASVKLNSWDALLDLYLLGPLRLSAGVIRNGNQFDITATPSGNVKIGDSTYTPSQVGQLTGTIDFNKGAGYLGLGIGGKGKIGFIMDLGLMFQGSPNVAYTATTSLTGPAYTAFQAQVTKEQNTIQNDLNGRSIFKVWPVVGMGLQVKI